MGNNISVDFSESILITEAEKSTILAEIENEFSHSFAASPHEIRYKANSTGLLIPLLVALLSLFLSAFSILLFNSMNNRTASEKPILELQENSNTEWIVMKAYIGDIIDKIEKQDRQILSYESQIAEYDRKLSSLRNLIVIKNETEIKLNEEREKLKSAGFSGEAIDSKILSMEEILRSDLSPEMIEFYDMSISELNNRINEILNYKTETESKLDNSINEKDTLEKEQQELEESIGSQTKNNLDNPREENTRLTEAEIQQEQGKLFTLFIQKKYISLYENLMSGNLDKSLQELNTIKTFFNNPGSESTLYNQDDLSFYTELNKMTERIIQEIALHRNTQLPSDFIEDPLYKDLEKLTLKLQNDYIRGDYETAEADLRHRIESVPELSAAYKLLHRIDTQEMEQRLSDAETAGVINETLTREPESKEIIGMISSIKFNRLTISLGENDLPASVKEFTVVRKHDNGSETVLGRGKIASVENETVQGTLDTLNNISMKPDIGDLIFFNPIP